MVLDRDPVINNESGAFFWVDDDIERTESRDIVRTLNTNFTPISRRLLRHVESMGQASKPVILDINIPFVEQVGQQLEKLKNDTNTKLDELLDKPKIYSSMIYDLDNPKYKLLTPIQIVLIEEDDDTIARIPELNIYSQSDTDAEAILSLKNEIIDLYEELLNTKIKLGPLPKSWLNTLKRIIVVSDE